MKIHHIGYLVKKIARAAEKFEKLGFCAVSDCVHDEARGIEILFMKNGETVIELVCPADPDSQVTGLVKRLGNTPYHICYETEDIEKDVEHLAQNGYVLVNPPQPAPAIDGKRVAFLMNGAIGLIELVES
ncbi:MAG: VOC family protein [Clostridia bacterium]|nr:VOC family protein [Clostridia bacterium]